MAYTASNGEAAMLLGALSEHTELDRRLHVEDMHLFPLEMFEQPVRFFFADRHDDLLRLVRELEEVCRMDASMRAVPFAGREDRRAANAEIARGKHQPFGELLVMVAAVLLREERDLIALHDNPSLAPYAVDKMDSKSFRFVRQCHLVGVASLCARAPP